jgi:hypothetical protein
VIEQLLNVFWLILSVAAFVAFVVKAPKRRGRAALIVACMMALLFPIISVSDDLATSDFVEQVATLVLLMVIIFTLIAIARIRPLPIAVPAFTLVPRTDPRSPPCR